MVLDDIDYRVGRLAADPAGPVPACTGNRPVSTRRWPMSSVTTRCSSACPSCEALARQSHAAPLGGNRLDAPGRAAALAAADGCSDSTLPFDPPRGAALRLRRLALSRPQPRPGGAAACAGAVARPAPDAARGRARAGARRPGDDPRLQSGQPVGAAPAPGPARRAVGLAGSGTLVPAARRRVPRLLAPARLVAPAQLRGRGRALRLLSAAATPRRAGSNARPGWKRMGERWWPVLGAVYFLVAVKRVRGMRLVGLARHEARKARTRQRRGRQPAAPSHARRLCE